jgi:hypothetical protein
MVTLANIRYMNLAIGSGPAGHRRQLPVCRQRSVGRPKVREAEFDWAAEVAI